MESSNEFAELVKNLYACLAVCFVYLVFKSLINRQPNEVYTEFLEDIKKCEDITDCITVEFYIGKLKFMMSKSDLGKLKKALNDKKIKIAERTGLRLSLSQ